MVSLPPEDFFYFLLDQLQDFGKHESFTCKYISIRPRFKNNTNSLEASRGQQSQHTNHFHCTLIVMTQGCHGLLHHIEKPKMSIAVPNSHAWRQSQKKKAWDMIKNFPYFTLWHTRLVKSERFVWKSIRQSLGSEVSRVYAEPDISDDPMRLQWCKHCGDAVQTNPKHNSLWTWTTRTNRDTCKRR